MATRRRQATPKPPVIDDDDDDDDGFDDDSDNEGPAALARVAGLYAANPGSYRPAATVFRARSPTDARPGGWVGELPAGEIREAQRWVSQQPAGGPGYYVLTLLDAHLGQRVKGGVCNFRCDADNRAGRTASTTSAPSSPSAPSDVVALLMQELRDVRADMRAGGKNDGAPTMAQLLDATLGQARKYQEGYDAGFASGMRIGRMQTPEGSGWKPKDVTDVVAGVTEALQKWRKPAQLAAPIITVNPTTATTTTTTTPAATDDQQAALLRILRSALATKQTPQQVIALLRSVYGDDVLPELAKRLPGMIEAAGNGQSPELAELLQVPEHQQWMQDAGGALADELNRLAAEKEKQ